MMHSKDLISNLVLSLKSLDLTPSQRQRCLALFAMQNDPFGVMSQWLYSQSLERENLQTQTIAHQESDLNELKAMLEDFEIEIADRETRLEDRDQTIEWQQQMIDEMNEAKTALFKRLQRQEHFMRQLYLGKEVLLELIASQMNEMDAINEAKTILTDTISNKEEELQELSRTFAEELMAIKLNVNSENIDRDLLEAVSQLSNWNEVLFQTLNEALNEIQRLIGRNN